MRCRRQNSTVTTKQTQMSRIDLVAAKLIRRQVTVLRASVQAETRIDSPTKTLCRGGLLHSFEKFRKDRVDATRNAMMVSEAKRCQRRKEAGAKKASNQPASQSHVRIPSCEKISDPAV